MSLNKFVQCRWLLRRLREVIFLTSTRKSQFSTSLLDIWKLFLLRLREGWEVIVWTLLFNLDVWAHMVEFCCYNYILYMLYKWCNIIIWKYFFWWEKSLHRRFVSSTGGVDVSITNGSRYEPAVMGAHHQRFWNRRWWPRYHQRLKSNGTQNRWWCTFRTGGDRGGCSSGSNVQTYLSIVYAQI